MKNNSFQLGKYTYYETKPKSNKGLDGYKSHASTIYCIYYMSVVVGSCFSQFFIYKRLTNHGRSP